MDMKKILQALDGAASKPAAGSNDMKKFLSIVTEGKDTKTNRLSSAEQIAFNDHNEPKAFVKTNPVLNKPLKHETLIKSYVEQVLAERAEELEVKKAAIRERAANVVNRMRENAKVTKVDTGAKTVTYSDDATGVTTTVPQAMAKPTDGKVAVDQTQVAQGGDAAPEIKPGMEVDVSEISGPLRGRYARKAQISQAGAQMTKHFSRHDPEKVAKADREIAKREKGLARVKTRTDKWLAGEKEKKDAEAQAQKVKDKENLPQLKAQLADLEAKFDPQYDYSDDYGYWTQQRDLRQRIGHLRHKIDSIGEGDE